MTKMDPGFRRGDGGVVAWVMNVASAGVTSAESYVIWHYITRHSGESRNPSSKPSPENWSLWP